MREKKRKTYCHLTPLDACDFAAQLVRRAGFVFHHVALNGNTSAYYSYPGRVGYLRISTHGAPKVSDRRRHGPWFAVASLTFSYKAVFSDGTLIMKTDTIESAAAHAIGRFLITSVAADPAAESKLASIERPEGTP